MSCGVVVVLLLIHSVVIGLQLKLCGVAVGGATEFGFGEEDHGMIGR